SFVLFYSSRRRHTISKRDWSSDVCSSDLHLEDYIVNSQHTKYKLLKNEKTSKNIFSLKPDIVIEHNKKYKIIIDTKWKMVDSNRSEERRVGKECRKRRARYEKKEKKE